MHNICTPPRCNPHEKCMGSTTTSRETWRPFFFFIGSGAETFFFESRKVLSSPMTKNETALLDLTRLHVCIVAMITSECHQTYQLSKSKVFSISAPVAGPFSSPILVVLHSVTRRRPEVLCRPASLVVNLAPSARLRLRGSLRGLLCHFRRVCGAHVERVALT